MEIGNSGLKIIEGRHQPGPRFEARTFVRSMMYEHRETIIRRSAPPSFKGRLMRWRPPAAFIKMSPEATPLKSDV